MGTNSQIQQVGQLASITKSYAPDEGLIVPLEATQTAIAWMDDRGVTQPFFVTDYDKSICAAYDEVRDYFRHRPNMGEVVPLAVQRTQFPTRLTDPRMLFRAVLRRITEATGLSPVSTLSKTSIRRAQI